VRGALAGPRRPPPLLMLLQELMLCTSELMRCCGAASAAPGVQPGRQRLGLGPHDYRVQEPCGRATTGLRGHPPAPADCREGSGDHTHILSDPGWGCYRCDPQFSVDASSCAWGKVTAREHSQTGGDLSHMLHLLARPDQGVAVRVC